MNDAGDLVRLIDPDRVHPIWTADQDWQGRSACPLQRIERLVQPGTFVAAVDHWLDYDSAALGRRDAYRSIGDCLWLVPLDPEIVGARGTRGQRQDTAAGANPQSANTPNDRLQIGFWVYAECVCLDRHRDPGLAPPRTPGTAQTAYVAICPTGKRQHN